MYCGFHLTRLILQRAAGCVIDEGTGLRKAGRDLALMIIVPSKVNVKAVNACHKKERKKKEKY